MVVLLHLKPIKEGFGSYSVNVQGICATVHGMYSCTLLHRGKAEKEARINTETAQDTLKDTGWV